VKKINPFDTAYEQYQVVTTQMQSAIGVQEKNLFFRRRINLLSVMQFLLSESEFSN